MILNFFRFLTGAGLLLLGIITIQACVDKFEPKIDYNSKVVTVEGTLNNLSEEQKITLKTSESTRFSSVDRPITKAQVEVIVNGKDRLTLTEREAGVYYMPMGFKVQVGNTYQLYFKTPAGSEYESGLEAMTNVPKIEKIYDEFTEKALESNVNQRILYTPGHWIYVDTNDPAGERNFYQWSWTLWESQSICATCERGLFYLSYGNQTNICIADYRLPDGTVYDYNCNKPCWQIFYNPQLNVMSDSYSDGRPIIGRLAAKIPLYSRSGCLVEIKQTSLSSGAYRYLKLLAEQSQSTGTLADTPPAPITGNVHCKTNPEEPVVGYFQASGVIAIRYWLDRLNVQGNGRPIGLLGGREVTYEPMGTDLTRPPLANCTSGKFRTPFKPVGWQ